MHGVSAPTRPRKPLQRGFRRQGNGPASADPGLSLVGFPQRRLRHRQLFFDLLQSDPMYHGQFAISSCRQKWDRHFSKGASAFPGLAGLSRTMLRCRTRFASVWEGLMDLDAFRQMVAKNPKGFLGRYGLGNKILQEGGNLEEAVEHLRVAVQLDPLHVASHLALGRALAALGRNEEARPVLTAGINAASSGRSSGGVDLIPEMRALLQALG